MEEHLASRGRIVVRHGGRGITIIESRTFDTAGKRTVVFTSGHIAFRQSLLVRAADAGRIHRHEDLGSSVRVGVLAGTSSEARLLALTGLASSSGILAAGARVRTPRGEAVADGSADYVIDAAGSSPNLAGRLSVEPPSMGMPRVVYLDSKLGGAELMAALRAGRIDAVAKGEIGNRHTAHASGGEFAVTALDPETEHGGFALAAKDAALGACISRKLEWLTDGRRIGYRRWGEHVGCDHLAKIGGLTRLNSRIEEVGSCILTPRIPLILLVFR